MSYFEGQNVSVEYRWITDRYDALPAMAADLVQRHATVIFALGPPAVLAAKVPVAIGLRRYRLRQSCGD